MPFLRQQTCYRKRDSTLHAFGPYEGTIRMLWVWSRLEFSRSGLVVKGKFDTMKT